MSYAFARHDSEALRAWGDQVETHVATERERTDFERLLRARARRVTAGGFTTLGVPFFFALLFVAWSIALLAVHLEPPPLPHRPAAPELTAQGAALFGRHTIRR